MLQERHLADAVRLSGELEIMKSQAKVLLTIPVQVISDNQYLGQVLGFDQELINAVARQAMIAEMERRIDVHRDLLSRLGVQLGGAPARKKGVK